jgi:acyl-CoA dehydrogenase
LRQITGAAHFNEVFLTDVRVPLANVVGALDGGWAPARATLASESALIGGATHAGSRAEALIALAHAAGSAIDPLVRQRLALAVTRERILEWLGARVQQELLSGRAPTLDGSVLKVLWSRDRAAKGELAVTLLGPTGALTHPDAPRDAFWQTLLLNRFWASIGGGTDEVHRTMIGERALGLPAEPRVDRDVPYRVLAVEQVPSRS